MHIYIHDLDIKQEILARRMLLHSGTSNAINIRFAQELDNAKVWILKAGSAFIHYAQKNALQRHIEVLVFQQDAFAQLQANGILKPLSQQQLSLLIESHSNRSDIIPVASQKKLSFEELLYQGCSSQQGTVGVIYQNALFFIDFNKQTASYNRAARQLLEQPNYSLDKTMLHVSPQTRTPYQLPYQCTIFTLVWKLYHLFRQQDLIVPLQSDSTLKLGIWPNFETVNNDFDDYRIASLIQKKALSATQVSSLLKLSNKQVHAFFNTCFLTQIAAKAQPTEVIVFQEAQKSGVISGLWRKLRSAMSA